LVSSEHEAFACRLSQTGNAGERHIRPDISLPLAQGPIALLRFDGCVDDNHQKKQKLQLQTLIRDERLCWILVA
jgi:hypothetical protein